MVGASGRERTDGDDSRAFLKCFGQQVKLFRERAGLTRAEFGAQLSYGDDMVASVEQGRRIPRPTFIDHADELLDARGVLMAMKEQVDQARYPAFFRDAAKLEAKALELNVYDTHIVNGLLQTEDYARALFTMVRPPLDEETIEQRVAARLARQGIFDRQPAPSLSFVIEEAALRRPLGGREVLRGQLQQLLVRGAQRNVEIQVMPSKLEENAGVDGPFTLLTPDSGEQTAYMEVQGRSTIVTGRGDIRSLATRYGIIRSQALTPRESRAVIEKLLGEL